MGGIEKIIQLHYYANRHNTTLDIYRVIPNFDLQSLVKFDFFLKDYMYYCYELI